ncbi:squalene epoxidase-domain-containing protein [Chaetomidium leptoderma]|uniref:squalene monooxygenase n=1 Tax=Chaetomidium leptoderma TaxID=669021 RepID=A0AAN6VG36_9PEZI|nr:squalene epoxidase-domain-containing protein [Chaetomidium leptoderma]
MAPNFDVLVIGAGVAGCAIAVAFAKQGRRILVVERSLREPDRIIGELLQPGGVGALSKLGLAHCLSGIDATPVAGYHLFWKHEQATFWFCPLPVPPATTSTKPFGKPAGHSFHHGKFVASLRSAVGNTPNITLLEATALEILRDGMTGAVVGAVCSRNGGSPEKYYASLTVLADGATSNFRSQFTSHRPKARSRFWGLEMTDANLPLPGYAYGILGAGPPILMYQIGARETRILIDIPDETHSRLGAPKLVREYISQHVVPHIAESIRPNLVNAVKGGRLRSMPNAWMPSTRNATPGLIVLGDASNMRHPVTGAGMTVALKDAVLLADILAPEHITSLKDSDAVLKMMRRFHWKRKAYSASLNILAQALYLLFVSQDPTLVIMQRGFIRYVQEGEKNFAEPAWLMGGLIDNPLLLFYHFFRVALYAVGLHLRQADWIDIPMALFRSMLVGTTDILFANFLALFVCVWTILHHNLQARDDGYWTIFLQKCRWAALAVTAPEMLTLFAVMQWNAANISVKEMRGLGKPEWTRVHAFYANGGGFFLETPDFPAFPINSTSIHYLCTKKRINMPEITRDNIWDRSKADHFAKCVAFLQAGWTLFQIVARRSQELTITPLEIFTAAFIIPSLATAWFWASKPQNVAEPTVIRVDWTIANLLLEAGHVAQDPYVDTPLDFVEKPVWDGWRRRPSLLHFGGLDRRPLPRIPNDYSPPPPTGTEATIVWVVSVVHAGLHVLCWSFPFPTEMEKILWRTSSLTLLVVMTVGGLVPVLSTRPWFDFSFSMLWIWVREAEKKTWPRQWLFSLVVDSAYVLYILARIVIFVEIFAAFRAMPEDVYVCVDWTSFWPHVS